MTDQRAGPGVGANKGRVVSINVSGGGVPKRPISGARVSQSGLENDDHTDKVHHGGPDRAVCIFSLERVQDLQKEGHPIQVGSVGENLTVAGISWESIMPGVRLKIGEQVVLEVTSFTSPCHKIGRSFLDGRFIRISQKVHPGWSRVFAKVIAEGDIKSDDPIEIQQPW